MKKLLVLTWIAFGGACGPEAPKETGPLVLKGEALEDALIEVNKRFVKEENLLIERFLERRNLNAETTGSGLRIVRIKPGNGLKPQSGELVHIRYEVKLLDGTLCYALMDSSETEVFRVDFDAVESGIHEGIKSMEEGERVYLLMPSHRAFGLAGDREKIPPFNPVWYNITLVHIERL